MNRYLLYIVLFVAIDNVTGQTPVGGLGLRHIVRTEIMGADTLPHVDLPMVTIMPDWHFKNKREQIVYNKLVIHVKKTLPYARLASIKLIAINDSLSKIESEKDRKKYLEQAEKDLFAEFEDPLRRLSFTQGRILINLIDRETGNTGYSLIKDYKGGVSAFFWQSIARVFGSNLKDEYVPDAEDKMIEHIVIQIDNGLL